MHGATRPDQCKDAKHGEADPLGRGADAGTRYVHPRVGMLVHISHASRPHTDVNPRPQWPLAAVRHPAISAHHSRVSLPHGELNRKPSGSGRMPSPHHFGTLLTRFADPWRAPPKAPQWPRSLGGSTEGTSGCGELHHRTPVATVAWRHLMSSTHSNEEYI